MDQTISCRKIKSFHSGTTQINQALKLLYNIKQEVISKIEEAKLKIKRFCSSKSSGEKKTSVVVREKTASLLDRNISQIQNLHDVVVQDLADLKKNLETHIAVVEKTELIMNILNYKSYDIQFQFRTQFEKLKDQKDALPRLSSSGVQDPSVAIATVEIDDELSKLEETHQKNLDSIKEQKLDAQKAYETAVQMMDQNLSRMSSGVNKLMVLIEAEKSNLYASEAELIDTKFSKEVDEFKADIEKFTELQTKGWKVVYPEEMISEKLDQHGIKILHTGQLITEDGKAITFKQAQNSKVFEDLNPDVLRNIRENFISDKDQSNTSTSTTSFGSKMSSEDVNYLKDCLGKPLTLALAEITSLQPRDPIHYLGHWLFKYRYNQQMEDVNNIELDILTEKRNKLAKERWHKFIEEEAKAAVIDMIIRAEEIGMLNELTRIQRETEALEEMEGLDEEARDTLGTYNGPKTGQRPL